MAQSRYEMSFILGNLSISSLSSSALATPGRDSRPFLLLTVFLMPRNLFTKYPETIFGDEAPNQYGMALRTASSVLPTQIEKPSLPHLFPLPCRIIYRQVRVPVSFRISYDYAHSFFLRSRRHIHIPVWRVCSRLDRHTSKYVSHGKHRSSESVSTPGGRLD